MAITARKRLFLTDKGEVVEAGDERARTLLVGKGGQLSPAQVERYKLSEDQVKGTKAIRNQRVAGAVHPPRPAGMTLADQRNGPESPASASTGPSKSSGRHTKAGERHANAIGGPRSPLQDVHPDEPESERLAREGASPEVVKEADPRESKAGLRRLAGKRVGDAGKR